MSKLRRGRTCSEECRAGAHALCDEGALRFADPDCLQCTCEHHTVPTLKPLPVERCSWCDMPAAYEFSFVTGPPLAYACPEHQESPAALWPSSLRDGEPERYP